ncbi:MAG: TonB-dependent receptor [Myxococcaceae bacterium]|nr:TonB-dependent receptor [Myxococcaceae bacterium]
MSGSPPKRRSPSLTLAVLLVSAGSPALAQEAPVPGTQPAAEQQPPLSAPQQAAPEEEVLLSEEVVVTATRQPADIATIPGAVTVVTREQLEAKGQASNRNLGDALGKLVPGLAVGSQSTTTFGQTLRGRSVLVLIDGVLQSSARNVQHDLRGIDMSAVERVEVVRGTSAIYGEGASGGIINIITRRAGSGTPRFSTTVGTSLAPVASLDALGGNVTQTASGSAGAFDYSLSGSVDHTGSLFDAQGDRIPADPHGQGGLADTNAYDVFAKLGYSLSDVQRLSVTANHFTGFQDTQWASDPSVATTEPLSQKSRAISGLDLQEPQGTRNTLVSLAYDHDDLLGSTVHAQAYLRDHLTRFYPFDGRNAALYKAIIQSRLETRKGGGRLEIGTPLPFGLNLLWGADGASERTAQPVSLMDEATFVGSSGKVFRISGNSTWVPPLDLTSLAAFAQLEWKALEQLTVRVGARREETWLGVDDYTTLIGDDIRGAHKSFGRTLYNAGVVVKVLEPVSAFFNFAQGYSLPDLGLILRNAPAGSTVDTLDLRPQRVDMLEVGVRGRWSVVQASLSVYSNNSALGTSSKGLDKPVERAPERVYGMEATVDVTVTETLQLGGTFTWLEGQAQRADGSWGFLNSYRIPPLKATASVEHQTLPNWRNGLLVVASGSRNRFKGSTAFGERAVQPYTTVDLMSTLDVGPGSLRVSVSNLLNAQYYARESQLLRSGNNTSYAASRGAVATVSYTVTY